ncbi:ABC-2 transporter permease [Paraliobacillus ryukyuensis]|uniref:ABC-2 transporter permease n=1 Tax=Paraliobacillus ryukyuensis TaxID=200904 RepID=UPI0009A5F12C|nr:ABC-2 transporter permease [Paraliobacillus ryukyuensis]
MIKAMQFVIGMHGKSFSLLLMGTLVTFVLSLYVDMSWVFVVLILHYFLFMDILDKQNNNDIQTFVFSLPITRAMYVVANYLFFVLYTACFVFVLLGVYALVKAIIPSINSVANLRATTIVLGLSVLLIFCFLFPIYHLYTGSGKKSRAFVAVGIIPIYMFSFYGDPVAGYVYQTFTTGPIRLFVFIIVSFIGCAISFGIAREFVEKKNGV